MTAAAAPTSLAAPRQMSADNPALLNLLIVDDERSVREACREAASALGYRTFGVESAEQALCAIETQNIDVILQDLRVPGAAGLDVMRQIKPRRPDIEVVIATGHGTVQWAGTFWNGLRKLARFRMN